MRYIAHMDIASAPAIAPRTRALYLLALARNFYPAQHDRIVSLLMTEDRYGKRRAMLEREWREVLATERRGE